MAKIHDIPWKRITVEGATIVVSILLAFAIDAWWDERNQASANQEQLSRVAAEFRANTEELEEKLAQISGAIEATSEFMSWMGPEARDVPQEAFFTQWSKLYSIGYFTMDSAAADDFLAAGQVSSSQNQSIRDSIARWYTDAHHLESQYERLRFAHAGIGERLRVLVPMYHVHRRNPVMEGHPESKFPFDHTIVLSDSRAESLFGVYLIRLEFFSDEARELLERKEAILGLIGSTAAD